MTPGSYLDTIRDEGAALSRAADVDTTAPVPTCPGWTVATVLRHVGQVHRRAALMIQRRATAEIGFDVLPAAPDAAALGDWFRDGVADLVAALRSAGPDAPVWNWTAAPQTAAFWQRRMAHETAVHRWDAETALTFPSALRGPLAVDGVDELLTVFLPEQLSALPAQGLGGTLHLHSLDEPGEWLIRLAPGQAHITRKHVRGDATIRASASDLALFLWNRRGVADLEVLGERRVAGRWRELFTW